MSAQITFHRLRIVASFALLGAVVGGVLFHGVDSPIDLRTCGAVMGAGLAALKVCHIF
jgi:hypothetical protein